MFITPAVLEWNERGEPFASNFEDRYFNSENGLRETHHVFIDGNHLTARWKQPRHQTFVIVELGFGSGLNCFATWQHFLETAPSNQRLQFVSIEAYPLTKENIKRSIDKWSQLRGVSNQYIEHYPPLIKGCHRRVFGRVIIDLWFEDALFALSQMEGRVDAWFLDGFSPAKNPQMWDKKLFEEMARLSRQNATFSTFTAASQVRRDLMSAGFDVQKTRGFAKKREQLSGFYPTVSPHSKLPAWFQLPEITTKKAKIIGAGLAGTATALSLQRRGWECQVFEKNHISSGASGNHIGACYPLLNASHDISSQFYCNAFSFAQQHIAQFTNVSQAWDGISLENQTDILLQQAGWVSPKQLCHAQSPYCEIIYKEFTREDWLKNEYLSIFANGWEAMVFFPTLPLTPVRGQVSHLAANSLSLQLKKVLCKNIYLTPQLDNIHILGATHQRNCLDLQEKKADNLRNLQLLAENFPEWANLQIIGSRVGIRGTSLDHLPLIGMLPIYEEFMFNFKEIKKGLKWSAYPPLTTSKTYLNIAHGARGLTTIPLAAELLASQLNGEILPISRAIYQALQPARFWVRDLCRAKKL
ncbi:MAG: tRNA 5-methylaminomethyl-2-thiouridine biosynthesis bifunctional protein [Pseudomonadota bacterium]|jgi:tRNA 5-methylaminomethyl-2-thiouridine biosynthesis bifunctional protein